MPILSPGSIANWILQVLLLTLEEYGICREEACRCIGIGHGRLRRVLFGVEREKMMELVRWSSETIGIRPEELAYLAGQRANLTSYGPLGLAALASATFGDAVRVAIRFLPLTSSLYRIERREHDARHVDLILRENRPLEESMKNFAVWFTFGTLNRIIHGLLGDEAEEYRPLILLSMPVPPIDRALRDYPWLSELARFNASSFFVRLPREVFETKLPMANAFAAEKMLEDSEALLNDLEGSLSARAERLLAQSRYALPSLEALAKRLHVSPRTLHRGLEREGTSYREMVQAVRVRRAKDLLSEGKLNVTEVADMLGYSSSSSFSTSFKRVTGLSPREYMKSQKGS